MMPITRRKSMADGITRLEIETVLDLHRKGESVKLISEAIGISHTTVSIICMCGSADKYYAIANNRKENKK